MLISFLAFGLWSARDSLPRLARRRPRRFYASRPAPIALSGGRETLRGLRGRAANRIGRQRRRILLLKIPHCGVRRQQD
jgi:hypothetical protein